MLACPGEKRLAEGIEVEAEGDAAQRGIGGQAALARAEVVEKRLAVALNEAGVIAPRFAVAQAAQQEAHENQGQAVACALGSAELRDAFEGLQDAHRLLDPEDQITFRTR